MIDNSVMTVIKNNESRICVYYALVLIEKEAPCN